ncbi:MAG: AmmeMemoRadiSam system radical SAM enzyme [Candidatus Omnitrophica bacterium]|nr:AmmeMemoRadiSam system radical SAM enzyme [Candidatus Omnitrophota bacterium]
MKEALFYQKLKNKVVQCKLCPRECIISSGKRGFCGVRQNHDGVLFTLVYAKPVSMHVDPIEKKPLFHFLPGSSAFSVATVGCNLKCKFCQNWEISQRSPEEVEYMNLQPQDLIKKVEEAASPTIAYTYTEPTIFYEYMLETARLARQKGIRNIMHSSGYINEEPLRKLCKYLDAANIDLKGFTDDFYAKMSEATLGPVLRSLKILRQEGVHVEITNLILSGYNDDKESITAMCLWIKENLGADTPLHFSRAFPMYKLNMINPTPIDTLEKARGIAIDCGLKYVYIGNVGGNPAESTYCPNCNKILIRRVGYMVMESDLEDGKCKFCKENIAGIWK